MSLVVKPKTKNPPPQAFWLSAKGSAIPVQLHTTALLNMPEVFGLEHAPTGPDEMSSAIYTVIKSGWILGQTLGTGNIGFQIWAIGEKAVNTIRGFLENNHSGVAHVLVETVTPTGWWQFTLKEFLEKDYPDRWMLSFRQGRVLRCWTKNYNAKTGIHID